MVSQQLWLDSQQLLNYKVGGVNLPIWSSMRLTVAWLSIVDWKAGGTVWSVNNSGWTDNICSITKRVG